MIDSVDGDESTTVKNLSLALQVKIKLNEFLFFSVTGQRMCFCRRCIFDIQSSFPLLLQAASTLQQKLESAVSIFGTMVKNEENCGKSLGIYSISDFFWSLSKLLILL